MPFKTQKVNITTMQNIDTEKRAEDKNRKQVKKLGMEWNNMA